MVFLLSPITGTFYSRKWILTDGRRFQGLIRGKQRRWLLFILFKSIVSEGRGLVTETIPQLLLSTAFLATTRLIPGAERRGIIRSMPNRVGVSQPAICSAEKVPERLVIAK